MPPEPSAIFACAAWNPAPVVSAAAAAFDGPPGQAVLTTAGPVPAGAEPKVDGVECVDLGWFTPQGALDPLVSPQLASVATMLLVSVFVLTNTVSTDGSVRGLYRASLQLAERTADNATRGSEKGVKQFAGSVNKLVGGEEKKDNEKNNEANQNQNSPNQNSATPRPQGSEGKTGNSDSKNR